MGWYKRRYIPITVSRKDEARGNIVNTKGLDGIYTLTL